MIKTAMLYPNELAEIENNLGNRDRVMRLVAALAQKAYSEGYDDGHGDGYDSGAKEYYAEGYDEGLEAKK